ncbi:MAG: hypothetical protein HZA17_13365, partial [Nitrospirae bacterium]|nr:hypothetical protein [Nitrospirota bacterium]
MKKRGSGLRGLVKGERIISLCPFILVFLIGLAFALVASSASAMPVPSGGQFFMYDAGASPVAVSEPSIAQPVALGSVTEAGDKISIQVGLEAFDGPVDIYLGIYAPK